MNPGCLRARRSPVDRKLTDKQARFVEEYLKDLNATRAAERAGYKTPRQQGARLLSNAVIAEQISKAKHRRSERTEIKQDQVLRELALVAFSSMKQVASWNEDGVYFYDSEGLTDGQDKLIHEITETETIRSSTKDETVLSRRRKIKLHSKISALELLGKHLGLWDGSGATDPNASNKGSHFDAVLRAAETIAERERKRCGT